MVSSSDYTKATRKLYDALYGKLRVGQRRDRGRLDDIQAALSHAEKIGMDIHEAVVLQDPEPPKPRKKYERPENQWEGAEERLSELRGEEDE